MQALARQHAPAALRALAEIADNPSADAAARTDAREHLKLRLAQMRQMLVDPSLRPDIRRDIEDSIRPFNGH